MTRPGVGRGKAPAGNAGRIAAEGHNKPPPTLDDLPIPQDVAIGPDWTSQMLDIADVIGPRATLLFVDRYGGQQVTISAEFASGELIDLLGYKTAAKLELAYRRERMLVPRARVALARARRAPILALVRANAISGAEATRILRTSRTYLSHLVNQTDEGLPADARKRPPSPKNARQPDLFG